MRIVVVGATGNVGTALLRALHEEPRVTSVVGIARRLPDRGAEPYRHAEWVPVDLAAEDDPDDAPHDGTATEAVIARLAEHFRGADAVVHLAWAIQPAGDDTPLAPDAHA